MTANGILQIAVFFLIIVALTKPLGTYMARIFEGPPRRLEKVDLPALRHRPPAGADLDAIRGRRC